MARKWSNLNLPGALHYITGNFLDRTPVFTDPECCKVFLAELQKLNRNLAQQADHLCANAGSPSPDSQSPGWAHQGIHWPVESGFRKGHRSGPQRRFIFTETNKGHQVWQESLKDVALWSGWMIWQKINYIHANPVKAGLVRSAKDYYWSGFRSFHSQGDEPLAVDHDWWWPEDSEKLSQAMKEMGWYSFEKRR